MTFRHLTDAVLSALIAPPCAVCGRVIDRPLDGAVCPGCWGSVDVTAAAPFAPAPSLASGCAVGPYQGALRDIIHALKYDGRRSVAARLSQLMARHGGSVLSGADFVVPVPLHRARERERGFNQADDLARGLGPPVLRALRRVKATHPQVDLPAAERHMNVKGAFVIDGRATMATVLRRMTSAFALQNPTRPRTDGFGFRRGAVLVLVDDVTTTGATLDACARVLKAAGAREVRALTAARVVSARR